jgi:hypothetical protein
MIPFESVDISLGLSDDDIMEYHPLMIIEKNPQIGL